MATVGALVGMIPGGMILLTSTVLAVSVIRLAKKKVLINEMYCIETLARVDVICLDKTGTLTAEIMNVHEIINLNTNDEKDQDGALLHRCGKRRDQRHLAGDQRLYAGHRARGVLRDFIPFSSETKWSGGSFENGKTYIMGAAEFVFSDKEKYPRDLRKYKQDKGDRPYTRAWLLRSAVEGEHAPRTTSTRWR